jgi:nitrate/TMAO reductase-like tetraheme cytochrome c subunit
MHRKLLTLIVFVIAGCTATNTPAPASKPSEFKNLQVLPRDIPKEELIATMKSFSRGLGVRCDHCHVVTATTPKTEFDFPSDAKAQKRMARVMIQMTQQINGAWMQRVQQAEHSVAQAKAETSETDEAPVTVVCWTCHRGKQDPEPMPPPPPQAEAPKPSR